MCKNHLGVVVHTSTPMITSSGRQELKAILGYLASVRSAWIIWDSMWENKSVVCSHCSSEEKQDGQDDSEGKGTWIFNFKTWNVHGGRRELIPRNSLLSSACTYPMSSGIYAHTHQINKCKNIQKDNWFSLFCESNYATLSDHFHSHASRRLCY